MAKSKLRSKRKVTGGKYHRYRKKKSRELAGNPALTTIGERKVKRKRMRGGRIKLVLLRGDNVNTYIPSKKKHEILKVVEVVENKASKAFERSNIITKGCIVKTDKGNVKITSRPGQSGVLNGVLLE